MKKLAGQQRLLPVATALIAAILLCYVFLHFHRPHFVSTALRANIDSPSYGTYPVKPEPPKSASWSTLDRIYNGDMGKRKIFLDCGANTGSTYIMFHKMWPNPEEYQMISFEIDRRLKPYYAAFVNHTAMVPLGVAGKDSTFTAHTQDLWVPRDTRPRGEPGKKQASHWGGGSLFVFEKEWRSLGVSEDVKTIDLSNFIRQNVRQDDELILKIDIEGAEYEVLQKMLDDGTFSLVDRFFLEFHDWQPTGWTKEEKEALRTRMKKEGIRYGKWEAEYPTIPISKEIEPRVYDKKRAGQVVDRCQIAQSEIVLAVAAGMNSERADRLVKTVLAHSGIADQSIGVFVYGDFVKQHPGQIQEWMETNRVILGIRGDSPKPKWYYEQLNYKPDLEMNIISSLRQVTKFTGNQARWFYPDFRNDLMKTTALTFGLNYLNQTVRAPPTEPSEYLSPLFFSKRSVEKIPPLLEYIYGALKKKESNVLVMDSDFEEVWISSVFLLDFLTKQDSELKPVNFDQCSN